MSDLDVKKLTDTLEAVVERLIALERAAVDQGPQSLRLATLEEVVRELEKKIDVAIDAKAANREGTQGAKLSSPPAQIPGVNRGMFAVPRDVVAFAVGGGTDKRPMPIGIDHASLERDRQVRGYMLANPGVDYCVAFHRVFNVDGAPAAAAEQFAEPAQPERAPSQQEIGQARTAARVANVLFGFRGR